MENKIKMIVNGQSFEVPMDFSVLTSMMGQMGMIPARMPQATPLSYRPMPIQTSHERMEETFFDQFRGDLDVYKQDNFLSKDERILTALIALHKRVKMLEKQCVPRRLNVRARVMKNNIPGLEIPVTARAKSQTKVVSNTKENAKEKTSKAMPKKKVVKKTPVKKK